MTETRPRLQPGPDHPISIRPNAGHVSVRRASTVVAETDRALELRESDYPPVLYIPLEDVDQNVLRGSDEHTYCPFKGEASYYDIVTTDGDAAVGAVWYYPDPYPAVDAIRGHVAFYADRVSVTNGS